MGVMGYRIWKPVDNVEKYFITLPDDNEVIRFIDGPQDRREMYTDDISEKIAFPEGVDIREFTYEKIRGTNVYIPAGNNDRLIWISCGVSDKAIIYYGAPTLAEADMLMNEKLEEILRENEWELKPVELIQQILTDCSKTMRKICKRLYYVYE